MTIHHHRAFGRVIASEIRLPVEEITETCPSVRVVVAQLPGALPAEPIERALSPPLRPPALP